MMLLMLLVLSGTSAWVLENLRDSLIERTDERLISASETLAKQAYQDVFAPAQLQSTESGGDGSATTIDSNSWNELKSLLPGGFYVQFYSTDGKAISDPVAPSRRISRCCRRSPNPMSMRRAASTRWSAWSWVRSCANASAPPMP